MMHHRGSHATTPFKPTLPVVQSGYDLASQSTDARSQEDHVSTRCGSRTNSWSSDLAAQGEDDLRQIDCLRQTTSDAIYVPALGLQCGSRSRASSEDATSEAECGRAASVASSSVLYGEPSQALIFLDWDDTLFPTSQLFDRWGLDKWGSDVPEYVNAALEPWREAVRDYLNAACALSDRCVVVTNSKRPWVDVCVERFAPDLKPIFKGARGRLQVIYADEVSTEESPCGQASSASSAKARPASCGDGCLSGVFSCWRRTEGRASWQDVADQLTAAKRAAMEKEARSFYSRYPGQTWKNVLSFGDMQFEYDAVRGLSDNRRAACAATRRRKKTLVEAHQDWLRGGRRGSEPLSPSIRCCVRERLRTKAVLMPGAPTIEEMYWQLHLSRILLPAYVRLDSDLELSLRSAAKPMHAISQAINVPQLAGLTFSLGTSGVEEEVPPMGDEEAMQVLDQAAIAVHDAMFNDTTFGRRKSSISGLATSGIRMSMTRFVREALVERTSSSEGSPVAAP
eukprot:TRINITY_DN35090_c0_g1_i1.p1 TRINITY_DN35090_c0_g1~~TRINITY_DN35090_c0_g1_i1.p1  ORF type:complete len:511 (-),score=100.57 TRINITY_DN35090_c0_g1_i1:200-1732(-)